MIQGRFYPEKCSAPHLPIEHRKFGVKESTHPSHGVHSLPHREVRRRTSDELGTIPGKLAGNQLQASVGSRIQVPLQLASHTSRFHHMGDVGRCDLPGHGAI
jgi:hypothetical protein